MKLRSLDHFLACAYADEAHVIVANGSLYREDRSKKIGLTPQERAQYFATARHLINEALAHDADGLNCIKAKYGVGKTFVEGIAGLSSQMMKTGKTESKEMCLHELVKYTYDRKKSLRQLCEQFGVKMNALLKDKSFIDGYIAGIEWRAMQQVENALLHYLEEDVLDFRKIA